MYENCSICKDDMLIPRLYPQCGHTICESCMIKADKIINDSIGSAFIIPTYKCPLCRQKTLMPWYLRPINRYLLDLLRKNELYETKYKKYQENAIPPLIIPDNMNLAELTAKNRTNNAERIYKEILPLLFDAATNGNPFIIIKHNNKDIQRVVDLLSKKLFDRNKIYKITSTPHECTIELIPSLRSHKNEYVNNSYSDTVRLRATFRQLRDN